MYCLASVTSVLLAVWEQFLLRFLINTPCVKDEDHIFSRALIGF